MPLITEVEEAMEIAGNIFLVIGAVLLLILWSPVWFPIWVLRKVWPK